MKKYGLTEVNKAKPTPGHPSGKISCCSLQNKGDGGRLNQVWTCRESKVLARIHQQKAESDAEKSKLLRKTFKARHPKNIAKDKTSAAYFGSHKSKW